MYFLYFLNFCTHGALFFKNTKNMRSPPRGHILERDRVLERLGVTHLRDHVLERDHILERDLALERDHVLYRILALII